MKQHCTRFLDGRFWDVGSLASLVTETQREVGSAIKVGARETEALGVGAVINMRLHAQNPAVQAIRDYVVGHFQNPADKQRLEVAFGQSAVGLLINERILNLPPLVSLQLHLSLFEEMEAHQRKNGPGSEYRLDFLLLVTLAYRESSGDSSGPQATGKKQRETETQLEWFRPEEEIYMQHAVCSTIWPIYVQDQASRWTFDGRISQFKGKNFFGVPAFSTEERNSYFVGSNFSNSKDCCSICCN